MSLKNFITLREYTNGPYSLTLGEYDGKLCLCDWTDSVKFDAGLRKLARLMKCKTRYDDGDSHSPVLDLAAAQLDEYFARRRKAFSVPLTVTGSEFHRRAMDTLLTIPYGTTISYSDLSLMLNGGKTMSQCIGSCIGSNLLSIFIPCHRIVARQFSNGGYRGGLTVKKSLLALEASPDESDTENTPK